MWQVMLVFLFVAVFAWLVSESPALVIRKRPIDDEEWAQWLDDLRREHRR
ncbi:MAG: hypothetical protein ACRDZO_02735 [Egibacteraceae bacterium]